MPTLRLSHGQTLTGTDAQSALRFAAGSDGLELSADNRIEGRHYLPELARKPHAVRQVAPELLAELGPPWSGLWELLRSVRGELEAAQVLAPVPNFVPFLCQNRSHSVPFQRIVENARNPSATRT